MLVELELEGKTIKRLALSNNGAGVEHSNSVVYYGTLADELMSNAATAIKFGSWIMSEGLKAGSRSRLVGEAAASWNIREHKRAHLKQLKSWRESTI